MPVNITPIALDKLVTMSEHTEVAPIVGNPTLQPMTEAAAAPKRIGGKVLLMDAADQTAPQPVPPTTSQGAVMAPVPTRMPAAAAAKPGQDQAKPPQTAEELGSVRLRLRVDRGRISVIGAHAVPGVADIPERLDYGLAYEIADGDRRLAVGSIPDVGQRRSYPDPAGRPGLDGHHLEELESFEVNVRVPQRALSTAALPRLRVTLFRMKEQVAKPITAAPLAQQFTDQLRPVAEMRGIGLEALAEPVQAQLRRAMAPPNVTNPPR